MTPVIPANLCCGWLLAMLLTLSVSSMNIRYRLKKIAIDGGTKCPLYYFFFSRFPAISCCGGEAHTCFRASLKASEERSIPRAWFSLPLPIGEILWELR